MTDELTAINMMLDSISEAPIVSLPTGIPEAHQAQRTLTRINLEVQSRGLHCNREFDVSLVPLTTGINIGKIELHPDWFSIKPRYNEPYIKRGLFLYNLDERTYIFTQPVSVDLVVLLPFDDLPESHRYYIAVRAARVFQHQILGSDTLESFNVRDEMQAKVIMDGVEMRLSGHRMTDYRPVNSIIRRRF